ncbi:MAG TPA: DUF58 domain-containing protein, partial [Actinomycetota bacterium]|nr:DUF58 domain-containing protein [Actinomycetota bacterium]
MTRSVTPKLRRTVWLIAALAYAALLVGRVELLVLTAPFAVALTAGVALATVPELAVECGVSLDRCLEDDVVTATITLRSARALGEVHVALALPAGFEEVDPDVARLQEGGSVVAVALGPGEEEVVSVPLRAVRWGTHELGWVAVRIYAPGGFIVAEEAFDRRVEVKVFPRFERIARAVHPPETKVYSGNYVARSAGSGIEFSHVRPFEPGDRIRQVNWRVTTRRGNLHVNVSHPELNSDVVLFMDAFDDIGSTTGPGSVGSLELSVRGAAGVARHYLRGRDRVGLVSFGGMLSWLTASMGRTQIYRIVDHLLASRALFSYAWKDVTLLPRGTLPPSALVIAFSPLVDERSLGALRDLNARRFPLVIVDPIREADIVSDASPEGDLALRVWKLQREALRSE